MALKWTPFKEGVAEEGPCFSYNLHNMRCRLAVVSASNCGLRIQEDYGGFGIGKYQRDGVDDVIRRKMIFFFKISFLPNSFKYIIKRLSLSFRFKLFRTGPSVVKI